MSDETKLRIVLLGERLDEPGPGNYTVDLARVLTKRGHEVFLIATSPAGQDLFTGLEVPVRLARHLSAWGMGGVMRRWLLRELRVFGPHLLHATAPTLGPVVRHIAHALHVPSLITVHGAGDEKREWTARHLRGSSIIAVSQAVREDLVNKLHIRKAHITVIPPGVKVRPGPLATPQPDARIPVIGTLGALEYVEGQAILLEAAHKVVSRGVELQVLVAGRGPEKRALRERAAQLSLGDVVTFVEDVSRPVELLEIMDVFVLPTMRDGMVPVVLEAMGLGKPVIVSGASGVFAAVRDKHTGLVFEKGDADGLADALVRLMLKPDFAARIAREGRELVRRDFSLENMVDKTCQLYGRVASYHGSLVT